MLRITQRFTPEKFRIKIFTLVYRTISYYSYTILYLRYLLALLELSELAGALALLGLAYVLARICMPAPYIYLHSLV